jgi:beta-lactamase superfamily II metal-dependent hydrolase
LKHLSQRQRSMKQMTSSKLVILDVGHGNCAVLIDQKGIAVVDTGSGGTLIDFLQEHEIRVVDYVLVSHADSDHIAGLIGLLSINEIIVHRIYLNPDPQRTSQLWADLKSVMKEARSRGTRIENALSTSIPGELALGDATVRILAPSPELALSGVGGKSLEGKRVSAHTLSAVISIVMKGRPLALLPGDLDKHGMDELKGNNTALNAEILVFPHHGGLPGYDPAEFATQLCAAVRPQMVVFSIGRGKHQTPRPEVIAGILKVTPRPHIACTQLSSWCAAKLPLTSPTHLAPEIASGRERNHCCAGSLVITSEQLHPRLEDHASFVNAAAPTALCRNKLSSIVQIQPE